MRLETLLAAVTAAACVIASRPAAAQAPTVEIRGQVPTPQVVTVRPRAVPEYPRDVLVPALYDRHFADAMRSPYRVAPPLLSETPHRPPDVAPDTTVAPHVPRE